MMATKSNGLTDSALVAFSSVVMRFGAFFAVIIASRTVKLDALAEITTLLLGYQTVSSVAVGGFLPLITNRIAAAQGRPVALGLNVEVLYRISAVLSFVSAAGFFLIFWLFTDGFSPIAICLFGAATLLNIHFHKLQAFHQGCSDFGIYSKGNLVFAVMLLVTLPTMWVFAHSTTYAACFAIANASAFLYARASQRRRVAAFGQLQLQASRKARYLKSMTIRSLKLMATNAFVFPSFLIVSLSLTAASTSLETATYNILLQWRAILGLVPGAVAQAYLPRLSEKSGNQADLWKTFAMFYFAMAVGSVGCFVLFNPAIFAIYASEVANNTDAIFAFAAATTLGLINAFAGQYFFIRKRYNINFFGNAIWAVTLLGLVFFLTPDRATDAFYFMTTAAVIQMAFLAACFSRTRVHRA